MSSVIGAIAPLALAFVTGCGSVGDGIGPCVHEFRDASVHVRSAVDSATGAPIDSIFVSDVAINGSAIPAYLVLTNSHTSDAAMDDGFIRCSVPCAFGTRTGHWTMTVSARGYPARTVAFDASYRVFHGGCPSYEDIGTDVALRLAR